MEILVTLNESYLPPLQVMLTSLHLAHPGQPITLHLMHSGIPEESLEAVGSQCGLYGIQFSPIRVDDDLFEGAPVSAQYPRQMYYRLLAPQLLPRQLHRVLYLDPDVLILNSLLPLWQMDLEGKLFAAASQKGKAELASGLNQVGPAAEGKQGARQPADIVLQQHVPVDRVDRYIPPVVLHQFGQVGFQGAGHQLFKHRPPLEVHQFLQQRKLLDGEGDEDLQGGVQVLFCQALFQQGLGLPAHRPFQYIHDILKMVIEGLPGDMAFLNQCFYRDLINVSPLSQFPKGLSNQQLHIHRHVERYLPTADVSPNFITVWPREQYKRKPESRENPSQRQSAEALPEPPKAGTGRERTG